MNNSIKSNSEIRLASSVALILGLYLVITSTFYPISFLSPFDAKRIIQLFLITGFTMFALAWAPLRSQTLSQINRLSPISWALLTLFFLLGIVSSLRLEHPNYALADVALLFLFACLIAIIAASRDLAAEQFDKWGLALISIMGLFVFIQESMGFISGWVLGLEFSYNRALVHFGHPRFYSQLQTLTIPIIAALPLIFPTKAWLKPACIALLGLQWFLVIALAARGPAVSLLIAGVFIAFWMPANRKHWLKTHLFGMLAGVVIYGSFLLLNSAFLSQTLSGEFYSNSAGRAMMHTSGRTTFWQHSFADAIDNPLLGSGPSHYSCDSERWLPAHAHSFPMQVLGEWGFFAFILLIVLATLYGTKLLVQLKSIDQQPSNRETLCTLLAISLLAGVIHSCLSGVLVMPASQMTFAFVIGWFISFLPKRPFNRIGQNFSRATLVTAAVVAASMFYFATTELQKMEFRTSNLEAFGRMVPRFWQEGRVCEYSYLESEK